MLLRYCSKLRGGNDRRIAGREIHIQPFEAYILGRAKKEFLKDIGEIEIFSGESDIDKGMNLIIEAARKK